MFARPLIVPLALTLTTFPWVAFAAWLPGGAAVCVPCNTSNAAIAPDGAGGVFAVWEIGAIYAQHLTATGDLAPGWPAHGLPVCVSLNGPCCPWVIPDGAGGFFACWTDFRNNAVSQGDVYAQHVLADGTSAPGWAINGMPATQEPGGDQRGVLAPDGTGGVFVTWWTPSNNVWLQHLGASGTPAPGWPSNGIVACSLPSSVPMSVISDGAGGAIMAWTDARRGGQIPNGYDVYGVRYTASGTIGPGWAVNGNLLGPGQWKPLLVPDGTGGLYMVSASPSPNAFDANYYERRLTVDGTAAPGWPAGGIVVCSAPGDRWGLLTAPDGLGGVLVDWYDYRAPGSDVYGARVLPSAALASGWPVDGLRVSNPGEPNEFDFGLAPDGLGGAYFSWEDDNSLSSYVQHIAADGTIAPGWPPYGFGVVSGPASEQLMPQLVADNAGGAIAVWQTSGGSLIAQHFAPEGPTPVPVQLALASSQATADHVSLLWEGPGAGSLAATVERRTPQTVWQRVGAPVSDGTDRLRFDDRAIVPGKRYDYRLGWIEQSVQAHSAETWVDVPRTELALAGLWPNPSPGTPTVAFTLPNALPATLELLDVTGRRLAAREVGELGAGEHLVRLDEASSLHPGIYWVQLLQGGRRLLARGAVVR